MAVWMNIPGLEKVVGVGVTGSTVEVSLGAVPTGKYRKYERVVCQDENNALTNVVILVRSGGTDYLMSDKYTITAAYLYADTYPILVPERSRLVVQFVGSVDDDVLNVFGQYHEWPTQGGPWDAYGKVIPAQQ